MKIIALILFLWLNESLGEPGNLRIKFIGDEAYQLGKAPFWDENTDSLFQVNVFVGDVIQLDRKTGRTDKYHLKDYISVVIPIADRRNQFIISRRNHLLTFDLKTKCEHYITNVGNLQFNEGKADSKGRLWIGAFRNIIYQSPTNTANEMIYNGGVLYRLDGHKLTPIENFTLPNGMDWSLDNKYFYIADSKERKIYTYNYDLKTGTISNRKILIDFDDNPYFRKEEHPDGMAIDKNGKLWVAMVFGARIIQLDPKTGKIEGSIGTGTNHTISIAFGGPDYKNMFVTTGTLGLTEEQKENSPNIGKTLLITADFIQGKGPANRVHFN